MKWSTNQICPQTAKSNEKSQKIIILWGYDSRSDFDEQWCTTLHWWVGKSCSIGFWRRFLLSSKRSVQSWPHCKFHTIRECCAGCEWTRYYCAGIVARTFPDCRLAIGKVLSNKNSGEIKSLVDGILWAVNECEVDVISLSLAWGKYVKELEKAILVSIKKNVVVVCAASNLGRTSSYPIGYPARLGNVICVGSHDKSGQPSSFSCLQFQFSNVVIRLGRMYTAGIIVTLTSTDIDTTKQPM